MSRVRKKTKSRYLLLWIVRGIGEDTWVELSCYSITAHNDYTMYISLHEFIVEKHTQLRMKEFTSAVCKERLLWASSPNMFCSKGFEFVR